MDDVEKLDATEDGFIQYQLIGFCKATRLQYLNSDILLGNRCPLQKQHVDCEIADVFLKKGTKQHEDGGWGANSKGWAQLVINLPNAQDVTF